MMNGRYSMNSKKNYHWFFIVPVIIVILVFAARFFVTVDAGYVGVVTQFGRVTNRVLNPGLHWLAPWQCCERFDCRVQKMTTQTSCYSKDLQLINVDITLLANLRPNDAAKVYQEIGRKYMEQVIPRSHEILKQQIARYNAEEVVEQRDEIRKNILKECSERMGEIIAVEDVVLSDINFSDVYEKAIEQKQVAQQEALRAKYELERAKTEAEKAVELAKGEAEAIRVRAEALKNNPGIAQLEAIKKWNGVSPATVVIGSDASNIPVVFPVK